MLSSSSSSSLLLLLLPLLPLLLPLLLVAPCSGAVVAFTGGDFSGWETWDWSAMTHLGFWSDPSDDIKATAKRAGVRIFRTFLHFLFNLTSI